EGRTLKAGDVLAVGEPPAEPRLRSWHDPLAARASPTVLRVLPGPQADLFADETLTRLLAQTFVVASDSDRVGIRLVPASAAGTRQPPRPTADADPGVHDAGAPEGIRPE